MKKMNTDTAQKIVSSISSLNSIPDLNAGGCGVVAYYLAEQLIKAGYKAHIMELRYFDSDLMEMIFGPEPRPTFEDNTRNIHTAAVKHAKPKDLSIMGNDHYCVRCDNFYFDSRSFCETTNPKALDLKHAAYVVGEIPLADFEYVTIENRTGMWNTDYNTKHNGEIKSIIATAFSIL